MSLRTTLSNRIISLGGVVCLGMSFALLPAGVNVVRAEGGAEKLISVDPLLVATEPIVMTALPDEAAPGSAKGADEIRPGVSAQETPSGVTVLNTRGYNYGPPPAEIDPAAMQREGRKR